MPDILLVKHPSGFLMPSLAHDKELLDKWGAGEILRAKVNKPRSGAFHRRFFALVQVIHEGQEKYRNLEDTLTEIKVRTGHYREHITVTGEVVYVPKSISFAKCDELEFRELYSRTLDVALKDFLPNWSETEINAHVDRLIGFL